MWELIIEQGLCDESALFDAVAEAAKVPRLNLRLVRVDQSAASKLEVNWAQSHKIAPLWADPQRRTMAIAVVDPSQIDVLAQLSAHLGFEIRREIASPSEVTQLIQHQFFRETLDRDPGRVNRMAGASSDALDAAELVESERSSTPRDALDGLQRSSDPGLEGLFVGPARTEPEPSLKAKPRPPTPAIPPSPREMGALGLILEPPAAAPLKMSSDPEFPAGFSSLPHPQMPQTAAPGLTDDLELPPISLSAPPIPVAAMPSPPEVVGPTGSAPDAPFAALPFDHLESNGGPISQPAALDDAPLDLGLEADPPLPTPLPQAARLAPSASAVKVPTPPQAILARPASNKSGEQDALHRLWPIFSANQETARALKAVFELCLARGIITQEEYMTRLHNTPD